jgi:hypothetical protein
MAYQLCATRVIKALKTQYPTIVWSKENDTHKQNICNVILDVMREFSLLLDEEIFKKVFSVVYAGLNVREYVVPLIDIDIDPSLREYNEYNKEYDECVEEEMNPQTK